MKKAFHLPFLCICFALMLPFTACSPKYSGLMDALDTRPELGIMHDIIEAAGGPKTFLGNTKNFTMFAVTNEGASHVKASLQEAISNPEHITELQNLLKHATLEGKLTASELANYSGEIKTVGGNVLDITGTADNLMVNGVKVIQSIDLGNSIIHVTDEVF